MHVASKDYPAENICLCSLLLYFAQTIDYSSMHAFFKLFGYSSTSSSITDAVICDVFLELLYRKVVLKKALDDQEQIDDSLIITRLLLVIKTWLSEYDHSKTTGAAYSIGKKLSNHLKLLLTEKTLDPISTNIIRQILEKLSSKLVFPLSLESLSLSEKDRSFECPEKDTPVSSISRTSVTSISTSVNSVIVYDAEDRFAYFLNESPDSIASCCVYNSRKYFASIEIRELFADLPSNSLNMEKV